jgi:hypothetical protein
MVNATQMAKIFGKRIDVFLKSDHANEFINALMLTPFGGSSAPLKRDEIIKTLNGVNTWMHRILALKFAAWLDPKFEVWVFSTIDKILMGHYSEHREATSAKILAEQQLELKKKELLDKYPEFADFLTLQGKITDADKRRIKALRNSVQQLRLDLFPALQ